MKDKSMSKITLYLIGQAEWAGAATMAYALYRNAAGNLQTFSGVDYLPASLYEQTRAMVGK
jgi:hypothetical protein